MITTGVRATLRTAATSIGIGDGHDPCLSDSTNDRIDGLCDTRCRCDASPLSRSASSASQPTGAHRGLHGDSSKCGAQGRAAVTTTSGAMLPATTWVLALGALDEAHTMASIWHRRIGQSTTMGIGAKTRRIRNVRLLCNGGDVTTGNSVWGLPTQGSRKSRATPGAETKRSTTGKRLCNGGDGTTGNGVSGRP